MNPPRMHRAETDPPRTTGLPAADGHGLELEAHAGGSLAPVLRLAARRAAMLRHLANREMPDAAAGQARAS